MSIGNAHVYDQDVYDRGVRIDRHDNICSSQEARGCDAGDSIISTKCTNFFNISQLFRKSWIKQNLET